MLGTHDGGPIDVRRKRTMTAGAGHRLHGRRRARRRSQPLVDRGRRRRSPRRSRFEGISNQDNSTSTVAASIRPIPSGTSARTTMSRWSTCLRRVRQAGQSADRADEDRRPVGGIRGRGLHRPLGRPDRRLRPARGSLAPEPVHDARLATRSSSIASPSRRPATRPGRTIATPSHEPGLHSFPTIRSTGSGRTPTC